MKKSIRLSLTFAASALVGAIVVLFSLVVMATPQSSGLMNTVPDETPTNSSNLSMQVADSVCTLVGINAITAQLSKNAGVSLEDLTTKLMNAFKAAGVPGDVNDIILSESLGMIDAIYDSDVDVSTQQDLADLGVQVYDTCYEYVYPMQWSVNP